jgi:ABC-type branched-subunit amino acid transport system substrate-binding protein
MLPKKFDVLAVALDTMIGKGPRRIAHPIVAFAEDADRRLGKAAVLRYAIRLDGTPVPCCRVDEEAGGFDALLDTLTAGCGLTLKQGMGRLRRGFPRLETCRAALAVPRPADRRELLRRLYDDFADRHEFLKSLGEAGTLPAVLKIPLGLILQRPPLRWLYGEWLRRTRSLKWVAGGTDQDFLTYVSTARRPEGLRERILVEAFLRDLEWQFRSTIYSVGRRRRRWRFVLLFPEVRENGATGIFVRECAKALAARYRKKHRMRLTPVVVLAASGGDLAIPEALRENIGAGDDALEKAAEAFAARPGGRPALIVPAASPDTAGDSEALLDDDDAPYRTPRWFDRVPQIGATLGTAALVAGMAALVAWPTVVLPRPVTASAHTGPCDGTWVLPKTGERVGVTDGSCPLSSEPRLVGIERVIAAQNKQVQTVHHPYRTVVFLSPLTVPASIPGRPGQVSLDELRGLALAQDVAYQAAQHDPAVVPIRVLLANTGDRFVAGSAVASKVVERARTDKTLAAVIGISQSRTESHDAIQRLSSLQVPIVGSTTTSDQILSSSPLYYEIVPRNAREAEAIAQFLMHQPIAAGASGEMVQAKKAVVIEDPKDEYSQNLAEDFRRSFTGHGNQVIANYDYGPVEDGAHDPGNIGDILEGSADQLVQDVCNTIGRSPAFVFYASRAQLFPAILDKIDQTSECGGRELAIVGSDENARFVADHTIDVSRYPSVHFYDAAFSDLSQRSTPVAKDFSRRYRERYRESVGDSGAVDAYDAFNAAAKAIDLAYQQDPSIPHGVVASKMRDGLVRFNGVTGLITFDGQHETARVPPDKPIFVVAERPEGPKALLACGRYADGGEWSTWGAGFPCPHDQDGTR